MDDTQVQQMINHPQFQRMVKKKTHIATIFSVTVLIVYFGYLLAIGFNKAWFATPIASGTAVTTGICVGFGIIIFAVAITGIYVHKANGEFDAIAKAVVDEINREKMS